MATKRRPLVAFKSYAKPIYAPPRLPEKASTILSAIRTAKIPQTHLMVAFVFL